MEAGVGRKTEKDSQTSSRGGGVGRAALQEATLFIE